MAVLNSFQRIDRVLAGQPFGDGRDGAYTSGTIPTLVVKTCSGTATSTTLTADTDASPFAVGDVILLHQSRGTGVGQWEINKIDSVGSDQYTLNKALNYTYTDSGASQAQVIKIPQYTNVNVSSGTWTLAAWDENINGILPIACNGSFTHSGTITGTGKGYDGGLSVAGSGDATMEYGEGTAGTAATGASANATAGGGAARPGGGSANNKGGGGGGNGAAGSNGENNTNGGAAGGSADLITMIFGGGGGGAYSESGTPSVTQEGESGGIIALFCRTVSSIAGLANNGNSGSDASGGNENMGGGGGSGGSVLICCESAVLGTNLIVASGGAAGVATGGAADQGGAGGTGRIAIHHSGTVTGTTTPTFEDVSDPSMLENVGGYSYMSI